MTTVFVAGSRAISRLNKQITERLDNIIEQQFTIIIGDANGADKAVQGYLSKIRYPNVLIHCMDVCRNNVGNWPTHQHLTKAGIKHDRHYFSIKDIAMAKEATCGFMLWDGQSKGTLSNLVNLLNARKKALLYLRSGKTFVSLRTFEDLHKALHTVGINDVSALFLSLGVTQQAALPLAR